jgi:RNA polymerase sigma-70 factor (ECF subfamily)
MEPIAAWYPRRRMGGDSDGELVARIHRGGEAGRAAEVLLCQRFAPRARLYGLRHLRDEDRARDLAQAVMVAVIEAARADRIEDCAKVDRFILGACRHVALRMRATDARAEACGDERLAAIAAPEVEHLERVDVGALLGCVEKLEERARQVVVLSFREERPADAIAAALATTPGNVRVLRHRAIAALRRCLDTGGAS